jgi:hypothetical protein
VTDKSSPKADTPPPVPCSDDEHERPTIQPPFDVAAFARTQMVLGVDLAPPEALVPETPSEQITVSNEVELERACVESSLDGDSPPTPRRRPFPVAPALEVSPASAPGPRRNLSPSSIEAAVLGAIEDASGPEITQRAIDDPMAEMSKCFSLQDYTGALGMAELILAEDPRNLAAVGCRENCRVRLENMYAARLRPDRVPIVLVPPAQACSLLIDRRAGFMLSLIDGSSTVEMILNESGMPKLDALGILHELVLQKIVGFA